MPAVPTIIVPAHNEAAVIERCLRPWSAAIEAGEIEVIVVANGCSDDTAARARRFSPGGKVRVIETPVGSKTNALNLGDAEARADAARVYVDADVILDLESLRKLLAAVGQANCLAAAPRVNHDLTGASWAVRAFYRVDRALPSSREPIGGSGVYAVSQAGRKRWQTFPDITADDGFVRRQFAAGERRLVGGAVSVVTAPRRLAGLVMIKTRSHFGTYELAERFPQLSANRGAGNRAALMRLALRPAWWASLAVYGYVKVVARLRAKHQMRHRRARPDATVVWERDESSRRILGAS